MKRPSARCWAKKCRVSFNFSTRDFGDAGIKVVSRWGHWCHREFHAPSFLSFVSRLLIQINLLSHWTRENRISPHRKDYSFCMWHYYIIIIIIVCSSGEEPEARSVICAPPAWPSEPFPNCKLPFQLNDKEYLLIWTRGVRAKNCLYPLPLRLLLFYCGFNLLDFHLSGCVKFTVLASSSFAHYYSLIAFIHQNKQRECNRHSYYAKIIARINLFY